MIFIDKVITWLSTFLIWCPANIFLTCNITSHHIRQEEFPHYPSRSYYIELSNAVIIYFLICIHFFSINLLLPSIPFDCSFFYSFNPSVTFTIPFYSTILPLSIYPCPALVLPLFDFSSFFIFFFMKVKNPHLMHQLWASATGNNYHNFSAIFTHDNMEVRIIDSTLQVFHQSSEIPPTFSISTNLYLFFFSVVLSCLGLEYNVEEYSRTGASLCAPECIFLIDMLSMETAQTKTKGAHTGATY